MKSVVSTVGFPRRLSHENTQVHVRITHPTDIKIKQQRFEVNLRYSLGYRSSTNNPVFTRKISRPQTINELIKFRIIRPNMNVERSRIFNIVRCRKIILHGSSTLLKTIPT
jgi:hypothetical protein